MEPEVISNLISNLGFPIACVVAMFWMWNKEREAHKEEANKMVEAINNNTRVMEKVLAKFDKE